MPCRLRIVHAEGRHTSRGADRPPVSRMKEFRKPKPLQNVHRELPNAALQQANARTQGHTYWPSAGAKTGSTKYHHGIDMIWSHVRAMVTIPWITVYCADPGRIDRHAP